MPDFKAKAYFWLLWASLLNSAISRWVHVLSIACCTTAPRASATNWRDLFCAGLLHPEMYILKPGRESTVME
jgi:hypothetical protein